MATRNTETCDRKQVATTGRLKRDANDYEASRGRQSFDKPFVRDWLETTGCDQESDPPRLLDDSVDHTRIKHIEALTQRAKHPFAWAGSRRSGPLEPWDAAGGGITPSI